MATSRTQYGACKLVKDRTLKLKTEAGRKPVYNGVVVTDDTLLVIDFMARNFQVYSHDGKLLYTSHELESNPMEACLISKTEVAVCLWNSKILILSLKSVDDVKLVKTLDVMTGFIVCHSVAKWNSDKLVVSGVKWDDWMLYWCVVNLTDGRVDSTHYICKGDGYWTHLAIKHNTVYISCRTSNSITNGVYAYDIFNPHTYKFLYRHHGWTPGSVMADEGNFIYVIDLNSNSIHQLTDSGQLVTIHTVSSRPYGIFYDDQHGVLYTTSRGSNVITVYRLEYLHQPGIPVEILNMDDRSIQLFEEALKDGKERVYNIRIMVVGHFGVGKATLVKRLLGDEVNISDRHSTEGIDVYVNCGDVSLSTHEWTRRTKDSEQDYQLQHLARVLNEQQLMMDKAMHEEQVKILPQGEITHRSYEVAHDLSSTASQQVESSPALAQRDPIQSETNIIAILKLLEEKNVYQLKQETDKTLPLTVWDLADQYAFYTTHQTFLTRRAIYLLLSDVSKQLTDLVADECFFDCDGKMKYKVHEVTEFWLNSIHCCTLSPEAGIPPVILVGTHVDKISQSGHYEIQEICKKYFREIRTCLENEPSRFHLVNEKFALDNTVVDRRLDDLKRKIVEVASQQPYCHVEIPARWIPLQQKLMRLKEAGVKVIPISLLKEMNQTGVVPLSAEELDLFVRFQHAFGTILYFSLDMLREKIVLEPQWLIDALKSLINADKMFILRLTKAVTEKWFEFKTKGKLSPELIDFASLSMFEFTEKSRNDYAWEAMVMFARVINWTDAIWTKERNQDFYVNKEYLLCIMEQLNIIAKPRSYTKDGKDIKQEDYYLVPCMLRQAMPREIISPESDPERESTSVLCFMYTGKILPPPIFHKLVGACLIHWPIAKKRSENHIYCGCCMFDLDYHHRLTLHFRGNIIFARVSRMRVKDTTWTSELCRKARELISENLSKIIGNHGESLPFVPHVKCPDSDPNSLEGLIAVSLLHGNEYVVCHSHEKSHELSSTQLLQYWFEEEEEFSTKYKPADIFSASSKYKSSIKESEKSDYLTERDITAPRSKFEQKKDSSQEIHSKLSDLTIHEESQASLQGRTLPPEMSAEWNFTVKELIEAWQSVEVYLSEELYPKSLLTFFEKISFLSAEECDDISKLRRRQVVKELLQRIKAKLPEAFSSFIHVLNETKQDVVVQGLRKQIEGTLGPRTTTHDEESDAVVSSIVYYKMKLELLKDGCMMHETESETRAYLDSGRILFYYNMRSLCLRVETGSIVVCLRPLSNLTKEGLLFFIQHDGVGNFVSDLLKRKSIFKSLPDGEMSIHVQVYCFDKDSQSEGADGQNRGYTQMDLQESFTVTDNPQMIKNNLNLQYDSLVEEIDPWFFKDMFIARGILDRNFFEELKSLKRRERAAHFLKTVMDNGSTALATLVDVLRNSELDYLANELCTVRDSSLQIRDEGDKGQVDVVQVDSKTIDHKSELWSGQFTATVRKNEDGDNTSDVMGSNAGIQPVNPGTSAQMVQQGVSIDVIYTRVTDQTTHKECPKPLHRRTLPPGKNYHAFFSYSSSDIDWVKQTVETLEKDHGFVCCEYDRDNTPGTPLLKFADDSIKHSYKTVVVMTKEAIQSRFVLHEIQMALNLEFNENRNCVVPVLLEDCEIPGYLSVLNYVDARDTKRRKVWWPKLVMELET